MTQLSPSGFDLTPPSAEERAKLEATLSREEAWGMARYLRTLQPGTETPRPDFGPPKKLP